MPEPTRREIREHLRGIDLDEGDTDLYNQLRRFKKFRRARSGAVLSDIAGATAAGVAGAPISQVGAIASQHAPGVGGDDRAAVMDQLIRLRESRAGVEAARARGDAELAAIEARHRADMDKTLAQLIGTALTSSNSAWATKYGADRDLEEVVLEALNPTMLEPREDDVVVNAVAKLGPIVRDARGVGEASLILADAMREIPREKRATALMQIQTDLDGQEGLNVSPAQWRSYLEGSVEAAGRESSDGSTLLSAMESVGEVAELRRRGAELREAGTNIVGVQDALAAWDGLRGPGANDPEAEAEALSTIEAFGEAPADNPEAWLLAKLGQSPPPRSVAEAKQMIQDTPGFSRFQRENGFAMDDDGRDRAWRVAMRAMKRRYREGRRNPTNLGSPGAVRPEDMVESRDLEIQGFEDLPDGTGEDLLDGEKAADTGKPTPSPAAQATAGADSGGAEATTPPAPRVTQGLATRGQEGVGRYTFDPNSNEVTPTPAASSSARQEATEDVMPGAPERPALRSSVEALRANFAGPGEEAPEPARRPMRSSVEALRANFAGPGEEEAPPPRRASVDDGYGDDDDDDDRSQEVGSRKWKRLKAALHNG